MSMMEGPSPPGFWNASQGAFPQQGGFNWKTLLAYLGAGLAGGGKVPPNQVIAQMRNAQTEQDLQGEELKSKKLANQLAELMGGIQTQRLNALYGDQSQSAPQTQPFPTDRMDALLKAGNGDIGQGAANLGTMPPALPQQSQGYLGIPGLSPQQAALMTPDQLTGLLAETFKPQNLRQGNSVVGRLPNGGFGPLYTQPTLPEGTTLQNGQITPIPGATAAARAMALAKQLPTPPKSPEAFTQDLQLRTPLPQAPMSPERLAQEKQLIKDRQAAQTAGDAALDNTAQLIANYQAQPLSSFAMRSPQGAEIMSRVKQINPDYDSRFYQASQATQTAFDKGPQGDQVRSLNVAIQHLDVLGKASDALKNGDIQRLNQLGQFFSQEFGSPVPTNFNAIKQIVSSEVIKAAVVRGGTKGERDQAQEDVSRASSPAQLAGVIDSWKSLLAGQMKGLKQQYESGTHLKNFDEKLLPETKAALSGQSTTPAPFKTGNPLVDKYLVP